MTIKEQAVSDAVWITIEAESAHYVDQGREIILCDRLPSPVTLVLKVKAASHPLEQQQSALHFVFDGPPGPECGRFVECETPDGRSVNAGEWHERADGLWELRVPIPRAALTASGVGRMRSAAQALIDDVRRRYPGEELRCPLMIELDTALQDNDGGMEGG